MTQRQLAYDILKDSYLKNQYVNIVFRNKIKLIDKIKRNFVLELVNGVIRNDLFLKYQFQHLINKKTKFEVIILLMMAYYEKHFMQNENYAIVNEYVNLAKKYDKGFVNYILRNNLDNFIEVSSQSDEELSLKYSLPLWIIKLLKAQYSEKEFEYFLNDYQDNKPIVYYHLNPLKAKKEDFKDVEFINDDIFISKDSLIESDEFKAGKMYIQDQGAYFIVEKLNVLKNSRVLDICAAPGSKSFNILEKLENKNSLYINDISNTRLQLIKEHSNKLGYKDLNFLNYDGIELKNKGFTFNRILADVPCSGLGVLKRKVDLKNKIQPVNLDELVKVQKDILESCYEMLENDGILVYSTCTINKKENERQIREFMQKHPDLTLIEEGLIIKPKSDIFYFAKIKK